MTREEIEVVLSCMPKSSKRLLMVGVLASWRTLYENKESGRYPKIENIKNIFVEHPLALNLVHYNTRRTDNLCEQLVQLTKVSGPNIHGLQLNIPWPPKDELYTYRSEYPNHKIVIMVNDDALNDVLYSQQSLVSKIKEYKDIVDYVLLDQSCGHGIPLDVEFMRRYLDVLYKEDLGLGIVVAGGLCSTTLNIIKTIINDFPDLSIDAEGKLRNQDDSLNLGLTYDYLYEALKISK